MSKKEHSNSILKNVIKGTLIALVVSLIGILLFALIIKLTDMSNNLISPINQVIKILSIFIGVMCALKHNKNKGLINGLLIGLLYTIMAFVIFSLLNKNFCFDKSLFNDLLFGCIAGVICGIISVNLKSKKA